MDVVERLTLEAAQADTMLACEHRHRYEFAAGSVRRRARSRPLLRQRLRNRDPRRQRARGGRRRQRCRHGRYRPGDARTASTPNVSFELADAVAFLGGDIAGRVRCRRLLRGPRAPAGAWTARWSCCASTPSAACGSSPRCRTASCSARTTRFHVTEFGYDEAISAFAAFPSVVMVPQFLAEGSLICPAGATETEVAVALEDRDEPEYANHFIFCVGFEPDEVQRAHHGRIQLNTSPVFNRWAEDLKRGAWALRRENARLARARLGKAGSAAASALASTGGARGPDRRRSRSAAGPRRRGSAELDERSLAPASGATSRGGCGATRPSGCPTPGARAARGGRGAAAGARSRGEDPNSWEHRRRRAAEC